MRIRSCVLLALLLGASHSLVASAVYSVTDLGNLGGSYSYGNAINNTGQVTGYSDTPSGNHAFLFSNGQMTDLGTLAGFTQSAGNGINNAGQVTGSSNNFGVFSGHAFLYSNGQMTDLGTLDASGSPNAYSYGNAINNAGQITGVSTTSSGSGHAFLYINGQMTDLGTPANFEGSSEGTAINDAGQVTGSLNSGPGPGRTFAFVYSQGQMMDLNDLIDPTLDITLTSAPGVNNRGQIVANGGPRPEPFPSGHAYLLTPVAVPEPSTCALLGFPLLALLAWSRRSCFTQ
jgi:probable HAF family extracellular repeat protein